MPSMSRSSSGAIASPLKPCLSPLFITTLAKPIVTVSSDAQASMSPTLWLQSPYQVGGSLGPDMGCYVERQADADLYQALKAGQFCYVLNCRQMGKSSLLVRTIARRQAAGDRCATLDMTSLGQQQVTLTQWYRGVVADLTRSFGVFDRVNYKTWWQDQGDIPPVQKLQRFIRDVLLVAFPQDALVICIDEIDSILSLEFSLDDFFALIRFCYNQRAIDPEYGRLTFAIFGVATPADLIQDRQVTPFNIGQAIALQGFRWDECQPLLQGLEAGVLNTKAILQAILHWTRGQPFLTQKLCALVWEHCHYRQDLPVKIVPGLEADGVAQLVHDHLIDQWEFQDEPEHLRTIQDRLLRHPHHRSRLLGQYQQILIQGAIPADGSPEQATLMLSGLISKGADGLRVSNPIYGTVFNAHWVRHRLQAVRPYSEAIAAWLASDQQDASRLLRGQALSDAQAWSQDQRLGNDDYQFLAASVAADRQATQQALEAERASAITTQLEQSQRHTRLQRWLLGVVSAAFLVSSGLGILALHQSQRATRSEQLARRSEIQALTASAQGWFASFHRLDALLEAIRARQKLDQLQNPDPALHREVDDVLRKIIFGINEANRFSGHQGAIRAMAYRPDGGQIASASTDGTIKLWQPDGVLLATLSGHRRGVNTIAFSPGGDRLFSGGGDNSLKVWDASTGDELQNWEGHGAGIISLAVSPQGDRLASGDIDGQIKLWRRDGTLIRTFSGHGAMVRALAFGPDGKILVSASADSTLKLWDPQGDGDGFIKTLTGHAATVTDVVFSPDGSRFASSSTDQTIRLWNRDGDSLNTLAGHRAAVATVRFSPDGQMLVSSSDDHDVRFWRNNGEPILAYSGITAVGSEIAFSPDGQYLASSGGGEDRAVVLWRLNSPLYSVFSGHQSSVIAIAISPDGQTLASTSSDRTLKLWRPDGTLLRTLEGHQAPVLDVDFSPDGQTLVSSSMDRTIRRWQLDGTPLGDVRPGVGAVVFSPDGQAIAAGSVQPIIQLWQTDGAELATLTGHRGPIISLAWNDSGDQLASGGRDNTINLWDFPTGALSTSLAGHTAPIWNLAFSPDNQILASASEDHTVKLWDLSLALPTQPMTTLIGHTDQVRDVTFSPTVAAASQQPLLASAGFDKTIKLWTLDGTLVTTLDRHTAKVQEVVFSPDGRLLFSASGDKTVIRWDLDAIVQLDPLDYACDWVRDYLKTSPTLSPEDQQLCEQ